MKRILIAMLCMTLFFICGGAITSMVFTSVVGGGAEQSFVYPIYGAIILLTGIIVGAAQIIFDEIKKLKKILEEKEKDKE